MYNIFQKILNKTQRVLLESFLMEALHFWSVLCKHNASAHTDRCREKMEYTLLRENHVIEKGMSMRTPKNGFGQAKVLALILRLIKYKQLYATQDPTFLIYPLSTIQQYIAYTQKNGISIPEIESAFQRLKCDIFLGAEYGAGIKEVSRQNILSGASVDFENFVKTRHSIRYFTKEIPSKDFLDHALRIAQGTPSACNRQGWKVHQFSGVKCTELLKWQGGGRGFEEEIPLAFLVTANLRAFLKHEPYQAYIDGGLYAMSLIYALHAVGLGTIPLSCGFFHKKLSKLNSDFDIPENEVPIVIIGVGNMLEKFNVAVSTRKPIEQTTVIH